MGSFLNELPGLRSFYALASDCWATFKRGGVLATSPLIVAYLPGATQERRILYVAWNYGPPAS